MWKYPSYVLHGDSSIGEFYPVALASGHQQVNTGTEMIHIGKNTKSTIISKGISVGHSQNSYHGLVKIVPTATNARNFTQCDLMLIGANREAHTFPYVECRNNSMQLEHEATASHIGEDQLFYCLQRGVSEEDTISMVISGFCKDMFSELSPEPAIEAQKLLAISLEHSVGQGINTLSIRDLHISVENRVILRGLSLDICPGKAHVITRPNGSGKSTLSATLAGREDCKVTGGTVEFRGKDLLALSPEGRVGEGTFMAFQYPVEIPGVSNQFFLRMALSTVRNYRSQETLDRFDPQDLMGEKIVLLEMPEGLLTRSVNIGFPDGEKKRNDISQMVVLELELCILDESGSELDIGTLEVVADGMNSLRSGRCSFIVVMHYRRILDYIKPDCVHVLCQGRIVESGNFMLAKQLGEQSYGWPTEQQ